MGYEPIAVIGKAGAGNYPGSTHPSAPHLLDFIVTAYLQTGKEHRAPAPDSHWQSRLSSDHRSCDVVPTFRLGPRAALARGSLAAGPLGCRFFADVTTPFCETGYRGEAASSALD
jgi:hypothetical protein